MTISIALIIIHLIKYSQCLHLPFDILKISKQNEGKRIFI
jgi:hypothetical protein